VSGKARRLPDVIVFAIVGACIITGVVYYFYRPPIDEPYYLKTPDEDGWNLNIVFTSHDVFGARTPITVSIAASPNFVTNRTNVFVYFPESTNNPPLYNQDGILVTPAANLELKEDGKFRGSQTIIYRSEGLKYIIFSEGQLPTIPSELLRPQVTGQLDIIHISSENSKIGYETGKATVFLAIVAAGLGVGSLREPLRRIMS